MAHRLHQCGFRKIVMTDLIVPLAERRGVSFCEAIMDGQKEVCEVVAQRAEPSMAMIDRLCAEGKIPVLADPETKILTLLRPDIFIDAVMAKRNTGTTIEYAPLVIALGPGFIAGKDAHFVVETNPHSRSLGRVISEGRAEENRGIPALIRGLDTERTIKSPEQGILHTLKKLGDRVTKGEVIGSVSGLPVKAPISGFIWGLVREGIMVRAGQKIGDIEPRGERKLCFEISAQARAIAGGVLEAIYRFYNR